MHENHRQRMRERYLQAGFDSFATHEILEMLLYYSIPRGDTNEIAHQLLEHFGSLKKLFEASEDELQEVPGIGVKAAIFLKMIPELTRRYAIEQDNLGPCFDSVSKIAQYFCRRFMGVDHECLYMMLLDNRMNILDCCLISEGTVNSSPAPMGVIMQKVMRKKASAVVLAHNHPHGLAIPSSSDLNLTDSLNNMLSSIDVVMLEHLIIAEDRFCPIMRQHCGTYRCSPLSRKIDSGFYDQFYDVDADEWTAPPIFKE